MEVLRVDRLQGVEERMLRSVIAPIAQIQAPNKGHQLPHGRVPVHSITCWQTHCACLVGDEAVKIFGVHLNTWLSIVTALQMTWKGVDQRPW